MKLRILVAVAGTALSVSACESSSEPAAAASGAVASDAAAAAPAAPASPEAAPASAAKGGKPDKAFMVGKWGEGGDCTVLAIDFKADGTMDGPVEKWNLEDGKLEMVGMPQRMHLTIVDADTMESRIDGTGEPRTLKRCK